MVRVRQEREASMRAYCQRIDRLSNLIRNVIGPQTWQAGQGRASPRKVLATPMSAEYNGLLIV